LTPLVVDASVVVKWYLPEAYSEDALQLLLSGRELFAPDLVDAQVGSVLWRRVRNGEVKRDDAIRVLQNLQRLPLRRVPIPDLTPMAFEIAAATTRTFNESLFFALALREETKLVTADRWWFNLLSTGPMKPLLRWVGEAAKECPEPRPVG